MRLAWCLLLLLRAGADDELELTIAFTTDLHGEIAPLKPRRR